LLCQVPVFPTKSHWQTPNSKPVAYAAYAKLGIVPSVPDGVIISGYEVQVRTLPHLRYEFYEALREIQMIRESQSLAVFLGIEASRGVVGFVSSSKLPSGLFFVITPLPYRLIHCLALLDLPKLDWLGI
jgi:hypothetical protein